MLQPEQFVVVGSGALTGRGIDIGRESSDRDVVVPDIHALGWPVEDRGSHQVAVSGNTEAMDSFNEKNYDQLLAGAEHIGGVPHASVQDVVEFKKRRGTEKDRNDVAAVERWQSSR